MLKNGRTLLRFPKPPVGGFTVYLPGDALPVDERDRVAAPFPYYRSVVRVEDEVEDTGEPIAEAPPAVAPVLMSPDVDTPRT